MSPSNPQLFSHLKIIGKPRPGKWRQTCGSPASELPGACQEPFLNLIPRSDLSADSGGTGSAVLVLECENSLRAEVTTDHSVWPQQSLSYFPLERVCVPTLCPPEKRVGGRPTCPPEVLALLTGTGRIKEEKKTVGEEPWKGSLPRGRPGSVFLPPRKASLANIRKPEWGQRTKSLTHSPFYLFKTVFPTCWNSSWIQITGSMHNEWMDGQTHRRTDGQTNRYRMREGTSNASWICEPSS